MSPASKPEHGAALAFRHSQIAPPFVRFERRSAAEFLVWIAMPEDHDEDALQAAIHSDAGRRKGLARAGVDHFGYALSPAEDELLTRYHAGDTAADFWAAAAAAGLVYVEQAEDLPPVSERTKALARRLGFVAIENTIARSPLMLAADLRSGAGRPASAAQKAITAVFVKNFAAAGCPTSGTVEASFAEISDLLGYGDRGGWQYEHIRDLVRGLRGAGVGGEWVTHDGDIADEWYGIIQQSLVTTKGAGTVRVRLSYAFQASIREAHFTYLEEEAVRRLNQASPRSDIPLNLWYFLQSQRLPWPHGWPIFRAPEGATQSPAGVRPLADILGLYGKSRRNVVTRIRAAATTIMAVFPEYAVTVKPDKVATMYRMFAKRRAVLGAPVDNSEEEAESVYEGVTATAESVYERVTGPCMSALQPQARFETGQVFKSVQSERDKEQTTGREEDRAPLVDFFQNDSRACPEKRLLSELDRHGWEPGYFADALGAALATELAAAICGQVRKESDGAACEDEGRGDKPCDLFNAAAESYGGALRHRIQRGEVEHPKAYVRAAIADAADNPTALLAGYLVDAEDRLAECHYVASERLAPADPATFGYTPKMVDPPPDDEDAGPTRHYTITYDNRGRVTVDPD